MSGELENHRWTVVFSLVFPYILYKSNSCRYRTSVILDRGGGGVKEGEREREKGREMIESRDEKES